MNIRAIDGIFRKKQTYTCYTYATEMYTGKLQNYDKRQNVYDTYKTSILAIESTVNHV